MNLLRGVIDPELGSDIVELGMAKGAVVDPDGTVHVRIGLTTAGCPLRAQIQRDIKARIENLPAVTKVHIDWTELTQEEKAAAMAKARWNKAQDAPVTAVPATTTGDHGRLGQGRRGQIVDQRQHRGRPRAARLHRRRARRRHLGFLRSRACSASTVASAAPSTPKAPSASRRTKSASATGLLKVVSMGFLVDQEETALMWRGLMLNRAVQHFLEDVQWGEIDYLVIDMPPGTGDVQMGLARMLPARRDDHRHVTVRRSRKRLRCASPTSDAAPICASSASSRTCRSFVNEEGKVYELFGPVAAAKSWHATSACRCSARSPSTSAVAIGGDDGEPVVFTSGPAADALNAIIDTLVSEAVPPIAMESCSARMLDAVMAALDAHD